MTAPTHGGVSAPPPLHGLEAEVMEEVWERGEASVREVMDALNAGPHKERADTTYMTIMARLDGKGLLERRREGKTDFYAPQYTRDQYADLRAGAELDHQRDRELAARSVLRRIPEADGVHLRRCARAAKPP